MLVERADDVLAAAGDDALRIARRRHRDLDRAAHHLLARDPGPAHRVGAAGVVGVPRGHGPRASGARAPVRLRGRGRRSAREIARAVPLYAGIERLPARATRCSGAGRALSPTAASPRRTASAHFAPVALRGRRSAPAVLRLDAARQAVQLDGPARRRSADRRRRDDVLISAGGRCARSGCRRRRACVLRSRHRHVRAAALPPPPIRPGNLEVHWPEGNVAARRRAARSRVARARLQRGRPAPGHGRHESDQLRPSPCPCH